MQPDQLFWIASMTKPTTATALMMLADEGKVNIEDPVEKYLPEFKGQMLVSEKDDDHALLIKPHRAVTVKDLLTHTSGLTSKLPAGSGSLVTMTLADAVVCYALSPLQFEPGTKWQYCNPGINTLGRIVEVISGMSYAEFMQRRLFDPLGMRDTGFWPTEQQAKRLATAYKLNKGKSALEATTLVPLSYPYAGPPRMAVPSGGLFSSAKDLASFYQMILNGGVAGGRQLIKTETLKRMTSNHTGEMKVGFSEGIHMGLGWQIVHQPQGVTDTLSPGSFGHGGAYCTQAWVDPERGLAMILLVQHANLGPADEAEVRGMIQRAAVAAFGK